MKHRLSRARSLGAIGLALVGAALAFSVSGAGASGSLVAYNVYPLVSDARPSAPARGCVARERLGPQRERRLTVVVGEQQVEHRRRSTPASARRTRPSSTFRAARPARSRTRARPTSRSARTASAARRASCSTRSAARSSAGRRPSTPRTRWSRSTTPRARRVYDGSRDGERPAVCDRLPQRSCRLVRRVVQAARASVQRSEASPKGWAPFGIQALDGNIYVTYAQQDGSKKIVSPGRRQRLRRRVHSRRRRSSRASRRRASPPHR